MKVMSEPFESVKIGPLTLRNRLAKSATNEGMARGGIVSKGLARFHERMAAGGAAMTTLAYCSTSLDGRTFVDQVTMTKDSVRDLKALTDGVHRHGAAASAQLTHAGSFTFLPKSESRATPVSASGGFNKTGILSGRLLKKKAGRAELNQLRDEFVSAAKLARESGFDAVELHMGHGYLLSQFTSKFYNHRRDAYGGGIEGRGRFPLEVARAVLDAVGKDMAVIAKYSMTDAIAAGSTIEDGMRFAQMLEGAGVHLAVLSNGLNIESGEAMFGSSMAASNEAVVQNKIVKLGMFLQSFVAPKKIEFRENYLRELALKVRASTKMPLAYLGGIQSLDGVRTAMSDGFDVVAMGRALVHDPSIVEQWKAGTRNKSECTACNRCILMMYSPGGTACVLTGENDARLNEVPAAQAA